MCKWQIHQLNISHNTPCLPPKLCINFVFNFLWVIQSSKEKLRTMLMQNFGRETRCILGDVNMANISPVHCWPTIRNIVGCNMLLPFAHPVGCCWPKFEIGLKPRANGPNDFQKYYFKLRYLEGTWSRLAHAQRQQSLISRGFSKRFNAIFELARLKASPKIKQNFVKLRHCQLSSLHYELASVKSGISLRLS